MVFLKVINPYDQELITEIPSDDAMSLEHKLNLLIASFNNRSSWLKTHERMEILNKTAKLLAGRKEEFAKLIATEGGKPLQDALIETTRAIDGLQDAACQLRHFGGVEIPMGLTKASDNRLAFTHREPIGVVAAISAFNHPLNLIVHQIAPAIAVGCPVIVKPASATPLSCIELVKLFWQAGLNENFCQTLITEDTALAEKLATDARIAFLSFIGSAKVGWYLRSKLAPGTRLALEHGGVAPVIVEASADFENAAKLITKGGYYHAGQVCVSVQRIFVQQNILASFMQKFERLVKALKVGNPLSAETEVGPIINAKEADRITTWIDEAVKGGARIIGGGRLSPTVLNPAILINPPFDVKISQCEVFGPVTCVYPYDSLDETIAIANSLPFAFQSSIFTNDLSTALKAAEWLDASTVLINDHTAFRTDWMPFAGRKTSGYGVGGIEWTMKEMTQEKLIVFNLNL